MQPMLDAHTVMDWAATSDLGIQAWIAWAIVDSHYQVEMFKAGIAIAHSRRTETSLIMPTAEPGVVGEIAAAPALPIPQKA